MPESMGWAEKAAAEIIRRVASAGPHKASFAIIIQSEFARNAIARIIVAEWVAANVSPYSEDLDFDRASGACVCDRCGLHYRDHPDERAVLSNTGEPFLVVLCDGRRVKL
jgi:hypothetical protein